MKYPFEILPQPRYKKIINDLSGHFLVRYTDRPAKSVGIVAMDEVASPRKNIRDLSTSLIGVFKYHYHKIRLTEEGKEKYGDYCQPDAFSGVPQYLADFNLKEDGGAWVVAIDSIHGNKFFFERDGIEDFIMCYVVHTPAKWNYWHFSLKWYDSKQEEIIKFTDSHANKARGLIAEHGSWGTPPFIGLPIEYYRCDWKARIYIKLKNAGLRKYIQSLISVYMYFMSRGRLVK